MSVMEQTVRRTIDRIDTLRKRAEVAEKLHKFWFGFQGEMVIEHVITIRRRWWTNRRVHSQMVLTDEETSALRDWLASRASSARAAADQLSETLDLKEES